MSAEVAKAIRQTRRTLAEKTWVPRQPDGDEGEVCTVTAIPDGALEDHVWDSLCVVADVDLLARWNDRQTDVGAILGMTLQALITELCKPGTCPPHDRGVRSSATRRAGRA